MRSPRYTLLPCVFALCSAGILDYDERGGAGGGYGDSGCPAGAQCMPADLCPAAAHFGRPGGLRPAARCISPLREARVCCWSPSGLSPSPLHPFGPPSLSPFPSLSSSPSLLDRLRYRRSVSSTESSSSVSPTSPGLEQGNASPSEKACQEYRALQFRRKRETNQFEVFFVVGGERALMSEFPYMVAIGYGRNGQGSDANLLWGCGGSLISDRYVLTAAHCITDARTQGLRPTALRLGVSHLAQGPRQADDFSVEAVTLHPQHQPQLKYFDLALLRTDRAVPFSAAQRPVCLASPATRLDNDTALVVAGWGATDPAGFEMSADLMKAELRVVSLEECKELIPAGSTLPRGLDDGMICAAEPNRKADTCRGDSGGPMVARVEGEDTLVGVTSFGGKPCAGRRPGVYAAVAPHLKWIEGIVWPSQ